MHEHHEVEGLALNFGWHALQHVRAHWIGEQMGNHEAFHGTAARCEALCAELGGEKQRPQHDSELVDIDPLLAQLEDVAQKGVLQRLQLVERTLMGCLPLGLENLVQGINVANPLRNPLHEVRVAHTQFRRSLLQRHTLCHQPLGSSKDFPTAATGQDDMRHRGWAWKLVERWQGGGMCNVIPYSHCTIFLPLSIFYSCVNLVQTRDGWSATLCCNNICAVEMSSHHQSCTQPSAKCTNIHHSLRTTKQLLCGAFQYVHV